MKSSIRKRSINMAGHKTSVSLEDEFWAALKEIARSKGTTTFELVTGINTDREGIHSNLSSAIRLFVLDHYRRLPLASLPAVDREPIPTEVSPD